MKLAVATQRVDLDDPVLGATVPKLQALAERVERLVVLTLHEGKHDLPENVRVRTLSSTRRGARGIRFAAALAAERPDAMLAHMAPVYAVLAAPFGAPVALWFTHPRDSRLLRIATRLSRVVLTVDERSFPFCSPKVRAIGHGIDVDRFRCVARAPREPLRLLALGRFSRVKRYDLIERAVHRVGGVEAEFVGPVLSDADRAYRASLAHTRDAVRWRDVPDLFAGYDALVSATEAGSADKAIFEAAAACLPVVASAPALASLLPAELRFADEDGLVERLEWLKAADRRALGAELRERVVRDHSVATWADRVVEALQ
jgi:glycosyltransferase involved in cell wall biosynthesis